MRIATWNINSVRLRAELVQHFLSNVGPDVLCLQETKSPVEALPLELFASLGYQHHFARGFKGYNGVLILSRLPIVASSSLSMCGRDDARHVLAVFEPGISIHNFYVPAGGDIPDRALNEKFGHKLDFLSEMSALFSKSKPQKSILVGDLNIAPNEDDVWSHKQMLKTVSHTPIEVEALFGVMKSGDWIDAARKLKPEGKLYSWWSYRNPGWQENDKGRRLDHLWVTPDLETRVQNVEFFRAYRLMDKPSDHIPVLMELS